MSYKENNNKEEEYYREQILPKFAKMDRLSVPEDIWQNIRFNIRQKENDPVPIFHWSNIFIVPQRVLATAAVFVLIFLSVFGYQEMTMYKQVNKSLNSMVAYLSTDMSLVNEEVKL